MENKEDIKKIFEGFYRAQEAQKYAQDIADGDKLFSENPAPKPSEETINIIKSKVNSAIAVKKRRQIRLSYIRIASAAAVIILGLAVSMNVIENRIKNNASILVVEESDFQQLDKIGAELSAAERYASDVVLYENDSFSNTENDMENGFNTGG